MVWSTGVTRPEVSRYGRISAGPASSDVTALPDGVAQLVDEPRREHLAGPVGEQRHLVRDGAEAGMGGGEHAERAAGADRTDEHVALGQLDDHLVRLAQRV